MLTVNLQFNHPRLGEVDGELNVDLTRETIRESMPKALGLPEGYQCFAQDDVLYCSAPEDVPVEIGTIVTEETHHVQTH